MVMAALVAIEPLPIGRETGLGGMNVVTSLAVRFQLDGTAG